jgi:hypothetical protein
MTPAPKGRMLTLLENVDLRTFRAPIKARAGTKVQLVTDDGGEMIQIKHANTTQPIPRRVTDIDKR